MSNSAREGHSQEPPGGSSSAERSVRIPQQARSRRTREAVLEAATLCFERNGYDETTTAMIASEAGIGVGTLYGYFRDKREILLELLDRTVAELADAIIERLDPARWDGADPRETVTTLIDAIFHTQKLRPGLQRILWERYFKDDEFRRPFEAIRDRIREAVEHFADAIAERGLLRDIDRESASFVIVNAVQWNATQAFVYGTPELIDRTAATTTELISRFIFRD